MNRATRRRTRAPAPVVLAAALLVLLLAPVFAAQPPSERAAALAAGGDFAAVIEVVDRWLAEHPGDPQLFPLLVQVVATVPQPGTVRAMLDRYGGLLPPDQITVLRSAPADWAELRGAVEQAIVALDPSAPGSAARREVLLLELGRSPRAPEIDPIAAPLAVTAGAARYADWHQSAGIETRLRAALAYAPDAEDGGTAGVVAGYGLISLLATSGRGGEARTVLEQLRARYPRSPEYALAAAELGVKPSGGPRLLRIVPFPSPAMLLGALPLAGSAPGSGTESTSIPLPEPVFLPEPTPTPPPAPAPIPVRSQVIVATSKPVRPTYERPENTPLVLPEPVAVTASDPEPASLGSATPGSATPGSATAGSGTTGNDARKSGAATRVTVTSAPDPAVFHVQAGSFRDSENALHLARQLRAAGFPAAVRERRGPDADDVLQLVAVGRNLTRAQAERLLTRLRAAGYDGTINRRSLPLALIGRSPRG